MNWIVLKKLYIYLRSSTAPKKSNENIKTMFFQELINVYLYNSYKRLVKFIHEKKKKTGE